MNILVTGAKSGLGKVVADCFGGRHVNRGEYSSLREEYGDRKYDVIFHCAFNASKDVRMCEATGYVEDNLFLTWDLLELDFEKFVYISSRDVYPQSLPIIKECVNFDLADLRGLYPFTKLCSELAVRRRARNFLICRPTSFLGTSMRPNTTYRVLVERNPKLYLSPESRFNYVLHREVAEFLKIAVRKDLTGIYNIASRGTVRLADICMQLELSPTFGEHLYDVGNIDNTKAAAEHPGFDKSSAEILNEFVDLLGDAFVGRGRLKTEPV